MKIKLISAAVLAGLLFGSQAAVAEESLLWALMTPLRQKELVPVENKLYKQECGACHFAYQPGLLPGKSWQKLLTHEALLDHFGEDADLDQESLKEIYDYALANAAEKSYHKRSRKIAISTAEGEPPLRITEVRYIKRKHHEIPDKMIRGNKKVKSLSNCNACHTQAADGVFDEDTVSIPNYPKY
jgi:mono/diheme cytochrome c family protein